MDTPEISAKRSVLTSSAVSVWNRIHELPKYGLGCLGIQKGQG